MRALIVYESIFGNTREVAQAVARGLSKRDDVELELVEVGHAPKSVGPIDPLIVGGPIHAWGMTRAGTREGARTQAAQKHVDPVSKGIGVREWLAELPLNPAAPAAAAFDTAIKTSWFPTGSAAKGERKALERAGYRVVAPPEHFYVKDTSGPVVPGELERAEAWAAALPIPSREVVH